MPPISSVLFAVLFAGLACLAPPSIASAAEADPAAIKTLRVGLAANRPDAALARLEPFRKALAAKLGIAVEILPQRDGLTLIDAAATGRIDYAILSASGFAMASRLCACLEPLAAPKSVDGSTSYRAILVARADGRTNTLDDLKGRVLAASDPASVAGRLVPFAALSAAGFDPASHFGRVDTLTGPAAAVKAVVAGKADAALAWSSMTGVEATGFSRGTLHDLAATGAIDLRTLKIVWQSEPIAHGPHAIRSDLPAALKTQLREFLIGLKDANPEAYDAVERLFGGGFVAVEPAAYDTLAPLVTPKAGAPAAPPATAPGAAAPAAAPSPTKG